MRDELGPHRICATDRASAPQGISQVRRSLSWGPLRKELLLLGSVSGDGLRPTHLSREPARHRDLPGRGGRQAVPHGYSQQCGAFDAGRCQRVARLAHLCRFRADANCNCAPVVRPRPDGCRSGPEPVCAGFDDHRSVPGTVSLGPVPALQGGGQDASRCWTCAAIFQRSCTSPTARYTT